MENTTVNAAATAAPQAAPKAAPKKKGMSQKANLLKGIMKENPVLVSLLGMCPTLAVTKTLESALGMGLAVLFVLVFSNLIVSLIRKIVPTEIRVPIYIIIIASLVTIVEMLMAAYVPSIHTQLGVFLPLITVNCIILGRAEAFASKNNPLSSVVDAIGMALGFTLAIGILASLREFLGTGGLTIWGELKFNLFKTTDSVKLGTGEVLTIIKDSALAIKLKNIYRPITILQDGAGAFLTLGVMLAFVTWRTNVKEDKKKAEMERKIAEAKAKKAAKDAAAAAAAANTEVTA